MNTKNPIEKMISLLNEQELWTRHLTLKRNEFLKVEGSVDVNLYMVEQGCIRIFVIDEYEEHTIRFGYANNLIAALDSFISEQPSDLYMQALRKSQLKVLAKDRFMGFVHNNDDAFELWYKVLESMVYQQMERERDILTSSPLDRYRRVFNRSPQLFQEVPDKYIASYLRMTPETLSRIKKS